MKMEKKEKLVIQFKDVDKGDLDLVGGKNASLGEMIQNLTAKGIAIPGGFATTSLAYFNFLEENNLTDKLRKILENVDIDNVTNLQKAGKKARALLASA